MGFPHLRSLLQRGSKGKRGRIKGRKQLEKALAKARSHSWLKHQFPEGIQSPAEDLEKMERPLTPC